MTFYLYPCHPSCARISFLYAYLMFVIGCGVYCNLLSFWALNNSSHVSVLVPLRFYTDYCQFILISIIFSENHWKSSSDLFKSSIYSNFGMRLEFIQIIQMSSPYCFHGLHFQYSGIFYIHHIYHCDFSKLHIGMDYFEENKDFLYFKLLILI